MQWYFILLLVISAIATVVPFVLAVLNFIEFYEAFLITVSILFIPLELIVILAYWLNKGIDFVLGIKTNNLH